ncbi:hypothetical protein CCL24_14860 [Pseudomonas congelans]|nr:hypothetical protein CCL24_14860 [Pseudomonas congelans]
MIAGGGNKVFRFYRMNRAFSVIAEGLDAVAGSHAGVTGEHLFKDFAKTDRTEDDGYKQCCAGRRAKVSLG